NYSYSFLDKFLRYVQIDTTSDPNSLTVPSTEKQKNLGKILVEELREMGISNAHLDENGYVYAYLESNQEYSIDPIFFCSHMDTSPDCSGSNVKPIVHSNYTGQDIVLPDDPSIIIKLKNHPQLESQIGNDIITASGTTLLGADNKAGVAEIMDAFNYMCQNPDFPHGKVYALFTPDEEIGRGADHVNLEKLQAKFGFTIDGENPGDLEVENFSADGLVLKIQGVSYHPGLAKGKLQSAIKIAAEIIQELPKDLSPEATEGLEGFIHPVHVEGAAEEAKIEFILRDFETKNLKNYGALIHEISEKIVNKYPGCSFSIDQKEQYRNMKDVLNEYPYIQKLAEYGLKMTGLNPSIHAIRGGTDGARLSFMGLPCPNLFAGEHAFHSKEEWVSVQDMEMAVNMILNIIYSHSMVAGGFEEIS
ncbi:MAG: peptidase, partial [Bacteroidota bacterium]